MATTSSGCNAYSIKEQWSYMLCAAINAAKEQKSDETMAKDNALIQKLKAGVDQRQIMPNIPQMGRFFSAVGTALQIAAEGRASPEEALQEALVSLRSK